MNASGILAWLIIGSFARSTAASTLDEQVSGTSAPATACLDDTWNAIAPPPTNPGWRPDLWTGYEMVFLESIRYYGPPLPGVRYNLRTNGWATTGISRPPNPTEEYSTIWTGTELIIWGGDTAVSPSGFVLYATGARYSPTTDTWIATSTVNTPDARAKHVAVWTGNEMIVWGGVTAASAPYGVNTGGRYSPRTDSWTSMSNTGAPSGRTFASVIWTGREMIVWGGYGVNEAPLSTGGRYNPETDTWVPTSTVNAPSARSGYTAVWTGSEMIVWGGTSDGSGARYNPGTDTWVPTSFGPVGRGAHSAVWTGSEMIVWGGYYDSALNPLNDGARYNPATDMWTPITQTGAPAPRGRHFAAWTGGKMIIWGGQYQMSHNVIALNDGAIYCVRTPLTLIHAVSLAVQGSSQFDLGVPVIGTVPIEARAGDGSATGHYTFALTFSDPVSSIDNVSLSCGSLLATSISDATYYVQFDGANCDQQYVTVTVSGVHDVYDDTLPSASATIGLLIGDTNGDGTVNAADAQQVRTRSGQEIDASKFRFDLNLDGAVNSADATIVRARSGHALP